MGQSASQQVDGEEPHSESPSDTKHKEKKSHKKHAKALKKSKSHAKLTDETATKRKRKSLDHDEDSVAPAPTTSSPRDAQSSRSVKRKKTHEEDDIEIEMPKSDDHKTVKATPKKKTNKEPATKSPTVTRSPAEQKHYTSPKPISKPYVAPTKKEEEQEEEEEEEGTTPESDQSSDDEKGGPPSQDKPRQRHSRIENKRRSGKGLVVGHFSPEEVQKIERYKLEFCNLYGITGTDFDEMVQHAVRDKPFPGVHIMPKLDFWKGIYEVIPDRDRRSVYRFMRRHFQSSAQKPHHWTREQDDELVELYEEHGPKFAYIASLLGRNDDDVVQRWKNRLQHRGTMNRGPWTDDEVTQLRDAIQEAWNKLKAERQNVGADIYEMDEKMVAWGHVSDKLQNRRSRQQCGDKWRKFRRKVLLERQHQGRGSVEPDQELQQHHMGKKLTGADTNDRNFKNTLSSAYVNSSDDEDDEDDYKGESPDDEKVETDRPDSDERKRTVYKSKEKASSPSNTSISKSKPDPDTDSGSDTSESNSESESESSSPSSSSDEDEESHTSMEPNTLRSIKHQQVNKQKALEPVELSRGNELRMPNRDSHGGNKQEAPKEKTKSTNTATAPNKHKQPLQDSDTSDESSSESEDDDSEVDGSQSSTHSQGSAQNKPQSARAQSQASDDNASTGASAGEKPASNSESDSSCSSSSSDSESDNESDSDMDLDLPPKHEPEKPTKPLPREDSNLKPRLSLLKQLKQDIKPPKPNSLFKAPAPAKDSSSSSDETESSSESSSDDSSDSSSEDEPEKPIKKASPVKTKVSVTASMPSKPEPVAKDADSSSDDSSSDDDEPAKPVKEGSPPLNKNSLVKEPKQGSAPPLASKSPSKPAIKPAPTDSESDDDSDNSSSSDESESERESKPTRSPNVKSQGQDRLIKRRPTSPPVSDSSSDSGPETKPSSTSRPTPTASTPRQSLDQGSKRKCTSGTDLALARSSATRNIKIERESSSEPDVNPPVKKTKAQSINSRGGNEKKEIKNSTPQYKRRTSVKQEQYSSDSSS